MVMTSPLELMQRRFAAMHGACLRPGYPDLLHVGRRDASRAALGYRRAGEERLYLERYLDRSVEQCLSDVLGRAVSRDKVIEIGNLAADDAFAMVELWGMAANDLGTECEIAVATLTAPLRRMFARIGVPLHILVPARAGRTDDAAAWGRYYDSDPRVCAGLIGEGQRAIAAFLARRARVAGEAAA